MVVVFFVCLVVVVGCLFLLLFGFVSLFVFKYKHPEEFHSFIFLRWEMLAFLLYHLQIQGHFHVLYISSQFHGCFLPLQVSNPLPHLAFTICLFKAMLSLNHQSPHITHVHSFSIYTVLPPPHPLAQHRGFWWAVHNDGQQDHVLFFLKFVAYGECLLAKQIVSSSANVNYLSPLMYAWNVKHHRCKLRWTRKSALYFSLSRSDSRWHYGSLLSSHLQRMRDSGST